MARDIDYAAIAVKTALLDKFGSADLQELQVTAGDTTISVHHQRGVVEGSRDDLLATVRKATTFAEWWELLTVPSRRTA